MAQSGDEGRSERAAAEPSSENAPAPAPPQRPPGYNPWFEPLGRRIAVLVVCAGWILVETLWAEFLGLWFWVATALGLWAVYDLFLTGKYGHADPKGSPP